MILQITTNNKQDFARLQTIIENSIFQMEKVINEFLTICFEVKSELEADELEKDLQKIINKNNINGYFELTEDLK